MGQKNDFVQMVEMVERLGIRLPANLDDDIFESLEFNSIRVFDFLPDFVMMIRSMVSKKDFTFDAGSITAVDEGILIALNNFFDDGLEDARAAKPILIEELPNIQIVPFHTPIRIEFVKHTHKKVLSIVVSLEYLKQLLKDNQSQFDYLFRKESRFFIEELMSADILRISNEISNAPINPPITDFYYRLKGLELLYCLFRDLGKRKETEHYNVSSKDFKAIYKVRDALITHLDKPPTVKELVKLAGMNELKLRRLFTQIFGIGLYDYFQRIRMQEAARLLQEEKLSVSEAGYQLGFTNLSHFTRLFEEHTGMKPKRWSMNKKP
jgi:AraC-like DNA-binding protein